MDCCLQPAPSPQPCQPPLPHAPHCPEPVRGLHSPTPARVPPHTTTLYPTHPRPSKPARCPPRCACDETRRPSPSGRWFRGRARDSAWRPKPLARAGRARRPCLPTKSTSSSWPVWRTWARSRVDGVATECVGPLPGGGRREGMYRGGAGVELAAAAVVLGPVSPSVGRRWRWRCTQLEEELQLCRTRRKNQRAPWTDLQCVAVVMVM
jgi:hypothetical protein